MTARALALACACLAGACGSNKPELPANFGPLEGCVSASYPSGPFGTEPGDTLQNACFQGWLRPDRVARESTTLEPVALADFYDPDGTRGHELLLLNTAALWCSACRIEHETLPEHAEELREHGLTVVSALFQGVEREPATFEDLSLWVDAYGTNFPIVLDPSYSFGLYASAETAPLNLVVDARTMVIAQKYIGDQAGVMWPYIETELNRRR